MTNLAPLLSSKADDWCTPECVLERVRATAPIDLDPCSNERSIVDAETSWTKQDNGLLQDWSPFVRNGLVYVNPPYGRAIGAWMEKCCSSCVDTIALVPSRTDTQWFQYWCNPSSTGTTVCFWRGRLTFLGASNPAPFPSAIVYWGSTFVDKFVEAFSSVGAIWL